MCRKITYGICPRCGKKILKGRYGWYCSNYVQGCSFCIYKRIKRFDDIIELSDEDVRQLLSNNTIKRTLTSRSGKKYGAYIGLENTGRYVNLKVKCLIK